MSESREYQIVHFTDAELEAAAEEAESVVESWGGYENALIRALDKLGIRRHPEPRHPGGLMGIIACRIQEDELPPQSRESLLANAFLKHLIRQGQADGDGPYVRPDNMHDVLIDGHVDMLALATAALVDFENWERAQQ